MFGIHMEAPSRRHVRISGKDNILSHAKRRFALFEVFLPSSAR
jgi:hypothetical protein